jgi:hypothetical protein
MTNLPIKVKVAITNDQSSEIYSISNLSGAVRGEDIIIYCRKYPQGIKPGVYFPSNSAFAIPKSWL